MSPFVQNGQKKMKGIISSKNESRQAALYRIVYPREDSKLELLVIVYSADAPFSTGRLY